MRLPGGCHCGNIAFTLDWPDGTRIPARECGCSFCRKHGGIWTSNPAAHLAVRMREPERTSHYSFGTRTARFHVCTACGVVPFVTSEVDGRLLAVVSVRALDAVGEGLIEPARHADFEGETEAARLARRARNWIGSVEGVR